MTAAAKREILALLEERERRNDLRTLPDDLPAYAHKCLKIRAKSGKVVQLAFNKAQDYIHRQLEKQKLETGRVRALILKGRQQGCCLAPDTKVLTADLRWVEIGSLLPGTELVATDEDTSSRSPGESGGGRGRKMRTATVEVLVRTRQPSYRITLDDGRQVVSSAKHRWLVRKSQTQWLWRSVEGTTPDGRDGIKVGDKFRSVADPWGDPTLEDAWFGGMIDGEGSMDCSESRTGIRLAVSQRAGPVLDRMEAHCLARGYGHYIVSDDGPRKTKLGQQAVHAVNLSSLREMFRVVGLSRPTRFISRRWWDGKSMPDNGERTIVAIDPVGEIDVVDIQTSTGTFIAEGFVTHNSTYVGGRYYHRTSFHKGLRTFILTHEDAATQNLFEMVNRYHEHCPPHLRPTTGAANAKELFFDKLDSGYKVGTAGNKGVGRSSTIQLFHGSEVAFWPHAEAHAAGVLQAVPDTDGTEVILESTANGVGNFFHQKWRDAERGIGDFIAIFVPWYWQEEYRKAYPDDFSLTDEEAEYASLYDLDLEQMAWRRNKIAELKDANLFKQEYPATAAEAFQMSGHDSYIPPALVARARKAELDESGPLVIGYDPAWKGADRHAMAWRRGRKLIRVTSKAKLDTMEGAGWAKQVLDLDKPERMFIDVGGVGAGVYDRLVEMGYGEVVKPVNFGSSPFEPQKLGSDGKAIGGGPLNRRAEMWMKSKEWLEQEGGADIPDSDSLQADACGPGYKYDSSTRLQLESKDDMRRRDVPSPDEWDAVALTFAEPVTPKKKVVLNFASEFR